MSSKDVYFTSDTHFWHKNIIKYCNRPFSEIEEMNEALIEKWNSKISSGSRVYHLGDFAFCGRKLYKELVSRLNGNIILILGNHDRRSLVPECFNGVYQQLYLKINNHRVYLNHFPFLCYSGSWLGLEATWQLFGHVHSGPLTSSGIDVGRLSNLLPSQLDVGVDGHDFSPWSWEEIEERIKDQMMSLGMYRG